MRIAGSFCGLFSQGDRRVAPFEYLQKKGWLKLEFITGLERYGVLSADR